MVIVDLKFEKLIGSSSFDIFWHFNVDGVYAQCQLKQMFIISSTTRFRWIQDSPEEEAPGWALDDIYVGESCPDMCHGRGLCKGGTCHCDEGYSGRFRGWGKAVRVVL